MALGLSILRRCQDDQYPQRVAVEWAACFYVNALSVMMHADSVENGKAMMQNSCSIVSMQIILCIYHDHDIE
jgi:hypothetical protein